MTEMSYESPRWREGHLVFDCPCLSGLFLSYLTVYLLWGSSFPFGGRSLGSVFTAPLGNWTFQWALNASVPWLLVS